MQAQRNKKSRVSKGGLRASYSKLCFADFYAFLFFKSQVA